MGYIYLNTPIGHIWYVYEFLPYLLNLPSNIIRKLLYYSFFIEEKEKRSLSKNSSKKITITQIIFASNYIQYLLRQINLLNKILKIKILLYTKLSCAKKKYIIRTINLLNLCILNNIQPQ